MRIKWEQAVENYANDFDVFWQWDGGASDIDSGEKREWLGMQGGTK